MKKIYLLSLLVLIFSSVFAQDNLTPVAINPDSTITGGYSKVWQKLEDNTGKLTIGQVSSHRFSNLFHFNNSSKSDLPVKAYWFRYRIQNKMDHNVAITVSSGAGYCDLYVSSDGANWKHYQNGWLVPWSKRDGLKLIKAIILNVKPGEDIIIYQRQRINQFYFLDPQFAALWNPDFANRIIRQYYVDNDILLSVYPIEYIVIGIALLAALFNLFFFRIVREKLYLWFSLMLIPYAINRFFDGNGPLDSGSTIFFLREMPFIGNLVFFITYNLSFYYFFRFISGYLELSDHFPLWNKLFKVFGIYFLVIIIAPFLIYSIPDGWNHVLILVQIIMRDVALLVLFMTFLFYATPKNFARYRVIYILPFLLMRLVALALDIYYIFSPLILHSVGSVTPGWITWVTNWWPLIELSSIILMTLFFSFDLFQRFRNMQIKIANQALEQEKERSQLIEEQKVELEKTVEERTAELKQSIINLKATQAQLIQSEKMASLGELTAGIAHEIQNPLNFVNNFSDVNKEMLEELKAESGKPKAERDKRLEIGLINDLIENEEKINHHGKRADAIVKGMLQHSKASSGKKEPTNINALADEYMHLAYHGLRAKDKTFNCEMVTNFDSKLPRIDVIPQDVGRVMLNLFNNAFYAVNQKQKTADKDYKPEVSVTTYSENNHITIKVKDNGIGIPDQIKDKIMQPFFTTKPTGEGTGLGLSLTYDMVVKGHGGSIQVNSVEGEETEFIISLPSN